MSVFEEFLKKHCPDGVEYVPLWSVTIWDKKFNSVDKDKQKTTIKYKYYLADELKQLAVENGDVKILTTNISNLFTLEKLVSNSLSYGEIVCIPWGGNPIVQYYKGKFITSDNRIATSIDVNKLDNKFLYYVLINKLDLISSFYRGAGIKHPDMSKVLDIIIPLPPIEVQKEIVRILDEFIEKTTKLQELLHRETILRKKQYEYYRDKLLTFNDNVEWKILNEVIISLNTGLNPRQFFRLNTDDAKNYYVTIRELQNNTIKFSEKTDKINDEALKLCNKRSNLEVGDVLFSGTGTIGETAIIDKFPSNWNIKEGIYSIKPNKSFLVPKFLMYLLKSSYIRDIYLAKADGGTVKSVPMKEMRNLKIPIPPLEEQERIVNILDKFDALCNDITRGLPAEIEMRKKQYEYYRDKLLTFKEKKC